MLNVFVVQQIKAVAFLGHRHPVEINIKFAEYLPTEYQIQTHFFVPILFFGFFLKSK